MTTPKGPSPQADIELAASIAVEYAALTSGGPRVETPLAARLLKHAKTYAKMASLLRELEWADTGERGFSDSDLPDTRCPICGELGYNGHSPDCRLATLLRELP